MNFKKYFGWAALIFSSNVFAQSSSSQLGNVNIGSMFANFSGASIAFMTVVWGVSFLTGIFVTILAIVKLREYAESGGYGRGPRPAGIVLMLIAGTLMIVLPSSISIVTQTMGLGPNSATHILSVSSSGSTQLDQSIRGVLLFIQLIGHIAFFRGLLVLKDLGEAKSQQATFGKALIYLIAGAAAINIQLTVHLLANTVAPGLSLPSGLSGLP